MGPEPTYNLNNLERFLTYLLDFYKIKGEDKMKKVQTYITTDLETLQKHINNLPMGLRYVGTNHKTNTGKVHYVKAIQKNNIGDLELPDQNYPVKCFFNVETLSTVLIFPDQTKVRVTVDTKEEGFTREGKTVTTGIVIALARRILGSRTSLVQFYDKFKTTEATEAFFYGVVMEYFISKGIVKTAENFYKWLTNFADKATITVRNPRPTD